MTIGIIGLGVVGSAVKHGFQRLGHQVSEFDIKFPATSIDSVLQTELCFICVPTPPDATGSCDISIVEKTVKDLKEKNYAGLIVIKSTVTPGTTDTLSKKYQLPLAFCPEFLRERAAFTDFVENHDLCAIGAYHVSDFEKIKLAHGSLPQHFAHLTPLEAEFSKYYSNIFNALRITFANEFYEVCHNAGADYAKIKQAMVFRHTINDVYLDCNENMRGFGGVCLPKDTAAFAGFVRSRGLDLKLFDLIVEENKKFRTTIFRGMREEVRTPKKILITGGAGFIGYHLCQHLLTDTSTEILLVDNLQRGQRDEDFEELLQNPRVKFLALDLTDPRSYEQLPTDVSHVYHLAAVNGTKWFYKIPHEVLRINTLSLIYILEWVKTLNKKPKFLFTSSNEAYAGALEAFGQLPIPTPETVPLVISDPYNPRWTYAATKLIGEQFVIQYAQQAGFSAVIVRPHNFYGPRAGHDHVIPEFCQRIQRREEPFTIFSPDETRTFCYITDAVKAMQMLMDSPATNTQPIETVHIGARDEVTMQALADTLFRVSGWKPFAIDVKPSPQGSVKRRLPNIEKIVNLINWQPEVTLEEGLRRTYDWYLRHPHVTV